jgi:hypothetical protein
MGGEEELELLEQALTVAFFEDSEKTLLECYAAALRADEQVFHQPIGVVS